jgi:hypothetical protein
MLILIKYPTVINLRMKVYRGKEGRKDGKKEGRKGRRERQKEGNLG